MMNFACAGLCSWQAYQEAFSRGVHSSNLLACWPASADESNIKGSCVHCLSSAMILCKAVRMQYQPTGQQAATSPVVIRHAPCLYLTNMAATVSRARAGFLGLFRGRYARPLAIGSSLMLFQQITGQPSVLYYAADVFARAGFSPGKDSTGVSVLLGLWKLVMTGAHTRAPDPTHHIPEVQLTVAVLLLLLAGLACTLKHMGASLVVQRDRNLFSYAKRMPSLDVLLQMTVHCRSLASPCM